MWQRTCIRVCLVFMSAVFVNGVQIGDVRLRGGVNNETHAYGRVEVWMPGWSSICRYGWDKKDAEVVCRQLNYSHGIALCCDKVVGQNYYVGARMDYVACTGNETRITDCSSEEPRLQHRRCYLKDYASVLCTKAPRKATYSSLNIGTALRPWGPVMLNYTHINGMICSDNWSDVDARVACREAGYSNGTASNNYWSMFHGPYWTSQVNCTGNEARLSDCDHVGFGKVTVCNSGRNAGAMCDRKGMVFRLAGDRNPRRGRFEVSIDGGWGTVCNSSWSTPDVSVFCRQIGFSGGAVIGDSYEGAPLKMYTTEMGCLGNESNLMSCPQTGWTQVPDTDIMCPDHSFDLSIMCLIPVWTLDTESNQEHGPLMFYRNTKFSLVCDEGFDDYAAKLICVPMGFADGRAICCSAYGPGKVDPSFTMSCTGNETSIQECVKEVTCKSPQYVSVICFRQNQIPISEAYKFGVRREPDAHGQVSAGHYGITGRICYQHWSDSEARVLCKSLGYKTGIGYHPTFAGQTRAATAPYLVSNVTCKGNETDISDCQFNTRLGLGDCTTQHMAAALCLNKPEDVEYRIAGGGPNYGRVEVGVNGQWGTMCMNYWGYEEATVLCKQLGFVMGGRLARLGNIGQGNGTIWMSHLMCNGTETSLHDCPYVPGFETEVSEMLDRIPDGRVAYYPGCRSQQRGDTLVFCVENTGAVTVASSKITQITPSTFFQTLSSSHQSDTGSVTDARSKTTHTASSTFSHIISSSPLSETCNPFIDVVFVVDSSTSTRSEGFNLSKNAIKLFTKHFTFSQISGVRVGVVVFNTGVRDTIPLEPFLDETDFVLAVDVLHYTHGNTEVSAGLRGAMEMLATQHRRDARQYVILITDGWVENDEESIEEADRIKNANVTVLSVNLEQSPRMSMLIALSSGARWTFNYTLYPALSHLMSDVATLVCNNAECPDGMYGVRCVLTCGHCRNDDVCNTVTGVCPNGCKDGYTGDECHEQCGPNTPQEDCSPDCGRCANDEICDPVTGYCPNNCEPGYKPPRCTEVCDPNTYGLNCGQVCDPCPENEICSPITGICPGQVCQNGRYGPRCEFTCGHCKNNAPCRKADGFCPGECADGYIGDRCDQVQCPAGQYGPPCRDCGHCIFGVNCRQSDGFCTSGCEDGYTGDRCEAGSTTVSPKSNSDTVNSNSQTSVPLTFVLSSYLLLIKLL